MYLYIYIYILYLYPYIYSVYICIYVYLFIYTRAQVLTGGGERAEGGARDRGCSAVIRL